MQASTELPDVPVMPETLLLLDLLVQEPCVDLRQMSELVLADVGATLQIQRLAGQEYGLAIDRPVRVADCISDLGLRTCLNAVSAQTISRVGRQRELAAFWSHSREIATATQQIAEATPEIDPEEAYLVGLLHGIGSLPALLNWRQPVADDLDSTALRLCELWSLPRCVTAFFEDMSLRRHSAIRSLVQSAHLRATRTSVPCPLEMVVRPFLYRKEEERLEPTA